MTSLAEVRRFATATAELGVELPPALADVLNAHTAALAVASPVGQAQPGEMLRADVQAGRLTAANVVRKVTAAADTVTRGMAVRDLVAAIEPTLARRFLTLLGGDPGAALITSLRPQFDSAVAGLTAAAAHIGPDTTANDVVDLGDEAVTAWREIGRHRRVLDTIQAQLIYPLAHELGLLSHGDVLRPAIREAAYLVDAEHRADLPGVAVLLHGTASSPGGRWHVMLRAGHQLRLNTPAEAVGVLNAHLAAEAEADEHSREQARLTVASHDVGGLVVTGSR